MAPFTPAWIEARRRHWTRHNAHLWLRATATRFELRPYKPKSPPREALEAAEARRWLNAEAVALPNLKRLVADIQRDLAHLAFLRKASFARKYNFNPDQPRVSAGNSDGGQWTIGGGLSGLMHLAGDPPTGDSPPELPKERPSTSPARTAALKAAAQLLMRFGGPLGKIAQGILWLNQYEDDIKAYVDPPKPMQELKDAVDEAPKAGYEIHHIVEQTSAARGGYPSYLINGSQNLVLIPKLKHQEITAWYARRNDKFDGKSPRDYLQGATWDDRKRVGIQALVDFGVLQP